MFFSQLVQLLLIKSTVIPKTLHLRFKPTGIEIAENLHQGFYFLLILCACKRFKYHHLRLVHSVYLHKLIFIWCKDKHIF